MTSIFIDRESGTTVLGIRERLAAWRDIMAEVDLVVLRLPDDAAKEATALAASLAAAVQNIGPMLGSHTGAGAQELADA
jgi:N-acetyl-gamma-glutamyl-phosphate reductase